MKIAAFVKAAFVCPVLLGSAHAAVFHAAADDEPGPPDFLEVACADARDTACYRMTTEDYCLGSYKFGPLSYLPLKAGMRLRAEIVPPASDGTVPLYAMLWANYREPDGRLLDTFDLYVRYGAPATETTFDCKASGLDMCAMSQPGGALRSVHLLAIGKADGMDAAMPYFVTTHKTTEYPLPDECKAISAKVAGSHPR